MEVGSKHFVHGADYLVLLFALLVRWLVSLHSYSGENNPPMYGDYEAQRHWMEITLNIPAKDWYKNTNDNNLTYWGIDYPPLTAYHSFLCGVVASLITPESVELHKSRGYESYLHKLFMRSSVFVVDLLIHIPAVYFYFACSQNSKKSSAGLYSTVLYPGLILIDYGHFQYNCVSLGFFILAIAFLSSSNFNIASLFFCLAVNYKQMELYHSLPIFCYILGRFLKRCKKHFILGLKFITPVTMVVLLTFAALWLPICSTWSDMRQILHRIFPVYRGIYEDKVASFWCVFNVFVKLHNYFSLDQMFKICLAITAVAILPSLVNLTLHPTFEKLKYCLVINSLCFFLFSFHVHEKSILLVAVPVALTFHENPFVASWFLLISVFSMLPLFIKDGLFLPFLSLFIIYYIICFLTRYKISLQFSSLENCIVGISNLSILGCFIISIISKYFDPPNRYPYLWPLLVSAYSFLHFVGTLIYYYYMQFSSLFKIKEL